MGASDTGKLHGYLARLQRDIADLDEATAVLVEDGQYNDVVIVDDRLVARFPKRAAHLAAARRASDLLAHVHDRLPLPVPRPTVVRLMDRQVGAAYVAYPAIAGEPFHTSIWESLGVEARETASQRSWRRSCARYTA